MNQTEHDFSQTNPLLLLSDHQVEQHTNGGLSRAFLRKKRWEGGGPRWLKIGRLVKYRLADILEYLQAQERN